MTRKDGEAFWILEKAHQTGHDAQGVSGPAKGAWSISGGVREVKEASGKSHYLYCADIVLSEDDPKGWRGYIASIQSADHIENGFSREEAETHARLIAAAPDLLAALEELRRRCEGEICDGEILDRADAALAKATKGTSSC